MTLKEAIQWAIDFKTLFGGAIVLVVVWIRNLIRKRKAKNSRALQIEALDLFLKSNPDALYSAHGLQNLVPELRTLDEDEIELLWWELTPLHNISENRTGCFKWALNNPKRIKWQPLRNS